jgi:hypothetical protein
MGVVPKWHGGSAKMAHHNNIYNNIDNYIYKYISYLISFLKIQFRETDEHENTGRTQ